MTMDHIAAQIKEMDDNWCERFSRVEEIVIRTDTAIRGDGIDKPGLMSEVRELQRGAKSRARLFWVFIAAGITAGVAAAFAAAGRLFNAGS